MEGALEYSIASLSPCPLNPRSGMDADKLADLAASIQTNGIIEPLVIRNGPGFMGWEVVAGCRRLEAAKLAGLQKVPVLIRRNMPDREALEVILIENCQREDLDPVDEAQTYRRLMVECGYTQSQLAGRIGKSQGAISAALQLLGAPDDVLAAVGRGEIAPSAVRAVNRWVKDPATQSEILADAKGKLGERASCAALTERAKAVAHSGGMQVRSRTDGEMTLQRAALALVRAINDARLAEWKDGHRWDPKGTIEAVVSAVRFIREEAGLAPDLALAVPQDWLDAKKLHDLGKSQEEIARRYGVSQVAVSYWLRKVKAHLNGGSA